MEIKTRGYYDLSHYSANRAHLYLALAAVYIYIYKH